MKIKNIQCLRLAIPPVANPTPPRAGSVGAEAVPLPLHIYRDFSRARGKHPGDVGDEIWVAVEAEDGTVGFGHTHWGSFVQPIVRDCYADLLKARDCLAIEYLNDLMWRASLRFGSRGVTSLAVSAIDIALWDLRGKLLEVPVYSLLGGPCRSCIDYYVTTSDLDWAMELGFKSFKIHNNAHYSDGTQGLNRLEDFVAKARETVGADADLMLNAVMSFNVDYAIRVVERLKPYCLRWLEEPFMPSDVRGLSTLKAAAPNLPLATGEDNRGRHEFRELINANCVDVVQPDIRWSGGLSESVKIYTLAEAAGLQTVVHAGGGMAAGQHFAAAFPESPLAEWVMFSKAGVPLSESIRVPGIKAPENGVVTLTDAPGFGYELSMSHFQRYEGS